eukprot:CAMPEP_0167741854 /NCGR_PEP_ID=MMETSP0110_2-20121227/1091_1 /TAXON_ID=629695 /ORGANISM="Gymnochlora sp., Strain CCMP2014" /LENGTH=333 /DNA_ID=CAMNT_0007625959 /DNA_START=1 /DNA_END=1002 /DNA_ORIENTATION=-
MLKRWIHPLVEYSHDIGGRKIPGKLDTSDVPIMHWEMQVDAIVCALVGKNHMTTDELRRTIENFTPLHQESLSYYEKWAVATSTILLERGLLSLDDFSCPDPADDGNEYKVGDIVRVKTETSHSPWPKPHLRTPGYVHGELGEVIQVLQEFPFPELLAYRRNGKKQRLYRVRFYQSQIWNQYEGKDTDTAVVEIYKPWLERTSLNSLPSPPPAKMAGTSQASCSLHHSDHHTHDSRADTEQTAIDLEGEDRPAMVLARQLQSALETKNIISADELRKQVEKIETWGTRSEGQRLVARAWVDPEFKNLLLQDAPALQPQANLESMLSMPLRQQF